jgi:hypothetical protein
MEIVQLCGYSTKRLGNISTIEVDSALMELLFKINEDTIIIENTCSCRNTSSNQKVKNRSQSVKLGSNKDELDHAKCLQNAPADYEDLAGFEESSRKFVIPEDIFRHKISGLRQVLVYLAYNSKLAFYSLIDTIRFLQYIQSIFITTSIVRGA